VPPLPLKYQIALAPAVVLVLIGGLLWFLVPHFSEIREQNEAVREWGRSIEHIRTAIAAGQRLDDIAARLEHDSKASREELHFSYLEQSGLFSGNILHPILLEKLSPDSRALIQAKEPATRFQENLDPRSTRAALASLLPRLEEWHSALWAQKGAAFIRYYDNVKDMTPRFITISFSVLGLCILAGLALTWLTVRRTTGRLRDLARTARALSTGEAAEIPTPVKVRDEIDDLARSLAQMTYQLLRVVSNEKLLKGAEDERRRIAMDLHDQTLSDLTGVARDLQSLRDRLPDDAEQLRSRLTQLDSGLEDTIRNIRAVMDDLHPQTLDLLGLDAALRSYLEKQRTRSDSPLHHLHVDPGLDRYLTDLQRVTLYRIALETVQNVIRHAHATRVEVDGRLSDGTVVLSIEDNGIGFDSEDIASRRGRGLANIEQRAKAIGAIVGWRRSRFSSGTRFELQLALPDSSNVGDATPALRVSSHA
jgi:two-component system, NarL family, sensor histidine kinase UhpB